MHCSGDMEHDRQIVVQHMCVHSHARARAHTNTQTRILEINYMKPYLLKLVVKHNES
jgi:hypothetical protein